MARFNWWLIGWIKPRIKPLSNEWIISEVCYKALLLECLKTCHHPLAGFFVGEMRGGSWISFSRLIISVLCHCWGEWIIGIVHLEGSAELLFCRLAVLVENWTLIIHSFRDDCLFKILYWLTATKCAFARDHTRVWSRASACMVASTGQTHQKFHKILFLKILFIHLIYTLLYLIMS